MIKYSGVTIAVIIAIIFALVYAPPLRFALLCMGIVFLYSMVAVFIIDRLTKGKKS